MSATRPVQWTVFICLLVASCARGEPPPKQPAIPVVTIPYAYQMPPEPPDLQPGNPLTGDAAEPQGPQSGLGIASGKHRTPFDTECVYYIVGDPERKTYPRRILALTEAWRRGLGIDSVEISCYNLYLKTPPDLQP